MFGMKNIAMLIGCLLFAKSVYSQKDSLAYDEHGKYTYYTVVNTHIGNDTLYSRGVAFIKQSLKLTGTENTLLEATATGSFIVHNKASIAKHDDGRIDFVFNFGVKDKRYRYWLTSFVYTPYFRDRYGNYVPDKGITIPLEDAPKKLADAYFNDILNQVAAFSKQTGDRLKAYLFTTALPTKAVEKKVISTKAW
jgi:hypothetical protein